MTPAGDPLESRRLGLPSYGKPFDGEDGGNVLSWVCQGCAGDGCAACGFTGRAKRKTGKTITNLIVQKARSGDVVTLTCSTGWCQKPFSVKPGDDSHGGICGLCRDRKRRGLAL